MSKSGLCPICLILLVASSVLYQFWGRPLIWTKATSPQVAIDEQAILTNNNHTVPTIQKALVIAEPLLVAKYGMDKIEMAKPLTVSLVDDVWIISGNNGIEFGLPINKVSGEILSK